MYIERQLEKKFIAVSEEYACVLLTGPSRGFAGRSGGAQTCQNRSCNVLEAAPCTGSHR